MSNQLSNYIKKQLKTILDQVHQTPTKHHTSMKKIKNLVAEAPISETQKQSIDRKIMKIQKAFSGKRSKTGLTKLTKQKQSLTPYNKNLFFQNMFLQEEILNNKHSHIKGHKRQLARSAVSLVNKEEESYEYLVDKLQGLRRTRMKKQEYLCDIMIKSQRLQRLQKLRLQNQDKYLKSKQLEKSYEKKRKKEDKIERKVKKAVQDNKKRVVHTLFRQYNHNLNDL